MVVEYLRGADGQVRALEVDGTTAIDSITHLPFGPLKSAIFGSTSLMRSYDQRYNLTGIGAGSLNRNYTRDGEGHVTSITDILEPTPDNRDETYSYDTVSNLLLEDGGGTYSYDAVGNTTFDGRFSYIYDELNRLIRVEDEGAIVATYGYDSSNRRIIKTVGTTTMHYLYDANSNLIAEAQADGTITREYLYLDGELIAINDYQNNPGLYYAINDHLGTPQQLIEADGTVVWQAAYLPFGKAQVTVEQVVNNIRFPGQYYDSETGLHYNWHRFYDPITGRYISADPIGLAGGMNLYAYVGGNPVNYFDPMGLWVKLCARKLNDKDGEPVEPRGNPFRHDYISVSGDVYSFQRGKTGIAYSDGIIDKVERPNNPKCQTICEDEVFDSYVIEAANEIGTPKYSVDAYLGTRMYSEGARNCQSWARDVLELAKSKYLQNEECPKCFKH